MQTAGGGLTLTAPHRNQKPCQCDGRGLQPGPAWRLRATRTELSVHRLPPGNVETPGARGLPRTLVGILEPHSSLGGRPEVMSVSGWRGDPEERGGVQTASGASGSARAPTRPQAAGSLSPASRGAGPAPAYKVTPKPERPGPCGVRHPASERPRGPRCLRGPPAPALSRSAPSVPSTPRTSPGREDGPLQP